MSRNGMIDHLVVTTFFAMALFVPTVYSAVRCCYRKGVPESCSEESDYCYYAKCTNGDVASGCSSQTTEMLLYSVNSYCRSLDNPRYLEYYTYKENSLKLCDCDRCNGGKFFCSINSPAQVREPGSGKSLRDLGCEAPTTTVTTTTTTKATTTTTEVPTTTSGKECDCDCENNEASGQQLAILHVGLGYFGLFSSLIAIRWI